MAKRSDEVVDIYDYTSTFPDIEDVIYNSSPSDTPFSSAVERKRSTNYTIEWAQYRNRDAKTTVDSGDDEGNPITPEARNRPQRFRNYHTTLSVDISVTGRAQAARTPGGKNKREVAKELMRAGLDLKRDIESVLMTPQAAVQGTYTDLDDTLTPSRTATIAPWIRSNFMGGSGSVAPTFSAALGYPTDTGTYGGVVNNLNVGNLDILAYGVMDRTNGKPTMLIAQPLTTRSLIRLVSTSESDSAGWTDLTRRQQFDYTDQKKLRAFAGIALIKTPYGLMTVHPSVFSDMAGGTNGRNSSLLIIDPEYWAISSYRSFDRNLMGTRGDSKEAYLVSDIALECGDEKTAAIHQGLFNVPPFGYTP